MTTTILKSSHPWLLSGALLLAAAVAAAGATEDRISKSFNVGAGGQLVMDVDRGSIEIKATSGNAVVVEVMRNAGGISSSRSEATLKTHAIEFTQQANDVRIHSEYKGERRRFWFTRGPQLRVRYLISVPKKYSTDLKTSGGSISISDLEGKVKARTSGGSLHFGNIDGPIWARTSGGSISLESCQQTVDVETSGGSLNIGDVAGPVVARTSGGSIRIRKARADVVAKTSGGSIEVQEVFGKIDASTSGGSVLARLSSQPKGDCSLRTSGGSIEVKLAQNIAVNLDAMTSGGRVTTELPVTVQGELKKTALKSKINGGGPALILKTSGGNVHIRKL